jgi:transcriptional regulator of acetoin/glycerol metabolism
MSDGVSLPEIEAALATVQSTLDQLTQRGHDEAAFELARAQYSASIRSSWPGNLSSLVGVLEKILANGTLKLTEEERARLARAADAFRRVQHP